MNVSTNTTVTEKYKNDKEDNNVVVVLRARMRERARGDLQATEKYMREVEAFADYWRQAVGTQLPPIGRGTIADMLDMGMEAELIAEVIDETSAAPRPSWAYAKAIFERLFWEKIFTVEAFRKQQLERKYGRYRPF